jgi:CHAD domain-containing protein
MSTDRPEGNELLGDATTTVAAALSATLTAQYQRVSRSWAAAREGDAAELRHVRIATRRIREALAIADRVNRGRQVSRLRRDVRRWTRALGPVRESAVTLDHFAEASRRHKWTAERVASFRRRLEKQDHRRRQALSTWLERADLGAMGRRLSVIADSLSHADSAAVEQALVSRVMRRARQVRHAALRCGTLYDPDRLHALRIAIKKLRYAVEIGALSGHVELRSIVTALTRMQRRLGELHDVQVLRAQTLELAKARTVALRSVGELAGDALERDCRTLHAQALAGLSGLDTVLAELRRLLAGTPNRRRQVLTAVDSVRSRKAAS